VVFSALELTYGVFRPIRDNAYAHTACSVPRFAVREDHALERDCLLLDCRDAIGGGGALDILAAMVSARALALIDSFRDEEAYENVLQVLESQIAGIHGRLPY
jgi:hypothetical protein